VSRVIGHYEIVRELGRGGMGRVHLAREVRLGRDAALKELGGLLDSREAASRFLREARLAGSLSHPNIVTVFEYLEVDAVPYIAMEYVPGGSLRPYWVARLDLAMFAGVMEGVLAGLAHAQSAGVVHRDLKPENVLVTAEGRVKIGDFGVARATEVAATESVATRSGVIVGTPRYMAPEQILSGEVGIWSDLYSVGVMAYEQLVGRLPFDGLDAPVAIFMRHVNEGIPSALEVRPDLDPEISRWLDRLLARDPAVRVRDPLEAWEQLEEIVLRLLGPRWRRASRLPLASAKSYAQEPSIAEVASVSTILPRSPALVDLAVRPQPGSELEAVGPASHGSIRVDRSSRALPQGQVTLLFSDIEGSTRLLDEFPDSYGELLAAHRAVLRRVWCDHDGVEVAADGDSFLVAFAYATQAVKAAREAHRALMLAEAEVGGAKVRIGVHTGAPRVRDGNYWGMDVHYAARLCAAAHGGQVLLSASTRALVSDMEVEDLGEHALKDFPGARSIFHLIVDGRTSHAFPPVRTLKSAQTNLPDQISSFIGRSVELTALRYLVSVNRIVSLVGPGGVGKTRLALRLGSELLGDSPSGVWLVDLAPIVDPDLVGVTVAAALALPARSGEDILQTLSRAVADRQLVIIVDNCEHVLETVAPLLGALLQHCPKLSVIATSREPLHIRGEQIYRVPSLSTPSESSQEPDDMEQFESVQLFVERARQQQREFELTTENAATVARVCRRLDGIPLAIELAAVRLRALSINDLDALLDRRFSLLKAGLRTVAPRQQTLLALIDWSYDLLSEPERDTLTRVSVFAASGFDLPSAVAVCTTGGASALEILDCLDALVDKSLVQATAAQGTVRYRLLETIREYALQKLSDLGPAHAEAVHTAHRDHYLSLVETMRLVGPDAETSLAHLELEVDNLRLALSHSLQDSDPRPGLRLAALLDSFWAYRGHSVEAVHILGQHLARPDAHLCTRERAHALLVRARRRTQSLGDFHVEADCDEALRIAQSLNDDHLTAQALVLLARAACHQAQHDRASALCERAAPLVESVDDWQLTLALLSVRGIVQLLRGEDARAIYLERIRLARQHGSRSLLAYALYHMGIAEMSRTDLPSARTYFEQAHELFTQLNDPEGRSVLQHQLGMVCYLEGDYRRARELFGDSLTAADRLGNNQMVSHALFGLALTTHDGQTAASLHGAASAHAERNGIQLSEDPVESQQYEADQLRLRTNLGNPTYERAWETGREFSPRDAVTVALNAGPLAQGRHS
jgi:predicted ATPase/serine/threonine protein kinase